MEKPYIYTAIHKHTGEIREFNDWMLRPRPEYQPITETVSMEVYNWDIWEDTRYKAKLRLYNYLTFTKQGKEIPSFKPFKGTEIGKSIPILNF